MLLGECREVILLSISQVRTSLLDETSRAQLPGPGPWIFGVAHCQAPIPGCRAVMKTKGFLGTTTGEGLSYSTTASEGLDINSKLGSSAWE